MCPYPTMGRKNEHMAMSVYEKIIAEGRGHVEFIWLHLFGEPLLNPNIYAMIDIAEESGIRVGLSTNVTPLTERASRALLDSRLSLLLLCLDGATKETYEAIRIGAKFEKVCANIRLFAEMKRNSSSRLKASLQMIGMDLNATERELFLSDWLQSGLDSVFVKGFHVWANQDSRLVSIGPKQEAATVGTCYEPWLGMVVLADGTVVPCCNDYSGRNRLGDLKTQTLREIWNGSEMRKLRRMLANPHSDRTGTICHKCPFPVSDPVDAKLGQGMFNPVEGHLGRYCMNSVGTGVLSRDLCQLVSIRLEEKIPRVSPGEVLAPEVTVSNRSSVALRSLGERPVHISYHWLHQTDNSVIVFEGLRSQLLPDLPAAGEHSYSVRVTAPDHEGSYRLQICLVQESVLWLDDEVSSCFCDVKVEATL